MNKKHVAGALRDIDQPMKKYIALFIAIVVLGAGSYFTERQFLSYSNSVIVASSSPIREIEATKTEPRKTAAKETPAKLNFTLSVDGQIYRGSIKDGATILDAMRALASSNFAFTGRDYPSLGFFVESINGKKNANGFYWILYINGKSSDLGVSQAKIRDGDQVEWKYEKGY